MKEWAAPISGQVTDIQKSTELSVSSISSILEIMNRVDSFTASIASAVEEQSVATQEISRGVSEASEGTIAVRNDVTEVEKVVSETAQTANQVEAASEDVRSQTNDLRSSIEVFLKQVAAV
ncbi:MAG: hypothetical protein AAGF59_07110 [Pseudomonadota bacterium]